MSRKRELTIAVFTLAAVASVGALVSWVDLGQGTTGPPPLPATTVIGGKTGAESADDTSSPYLAGGFDRAHSDLTVSELSTFSSFPVYWAGQSVGPYALTAILREHRKIEQPEGFDPVLVDDLSLVYGSCVPSADSGCSPPLEIQVWPSCQRPLARAKALGGRELTNGALEVPIVELSDRTEIATGNETVVVFGGRELRAQAIGQLKPANSKARQLVASKQDGTLPAPVSGEIDVGKPCK